MAQWTPSWSKLDLSHWICPVLSNITCGIPRRKEDGKEIINPSPEKPSVRVFRFSSHFQNMVKSRYGK